MFHILTIIFEKVKRSENKIRCFFIRLQIYSNLPSPRNPHILVFWIEIIIHKWYPKTVLSEECAGKRYAKYYSKCPICIFSILPKGRIG